MLLDIVDTFDIAIEYNRLKLLNFCHFMLSRGHEYDLIYEKTMRMWEKVEPDEDIRLKYIAAIVNKQNLKDLNKEVIDMTEAEAIAAVACVPHESKKRCDELLADLRRIKIEYRIKFDAKEYELAEIKFNEALSLNAKLIEILRGCDDSRALEYVETLPNRKQIDYKLVMQSLQKCYHVVCSPDTLKLNQPMIKLYEVR